MPLSRIHNDSLSDHIILDGTDSTGANANSKLLLDASAVDTDVNAAISYEINSNDAARQSFETIQVNNLKKRDGRNFIYSNRNKIINGDFIISQRGTTFTASDNGGNITGNNNDDKYTLDRWYLLSDGNDIVDVNHNSDNAPKTGQKCIRLDVETTNKKFGVAQIIESHYGSDLYGENVTLSFKAKVSSTTKLDNVKAGVVSWVGTADSVTSDIISAWGAEGTNPTLIANAHFQNTPANLGVTTEYQEFVIENVQVRPDTSNLIVFLFSDVTDTTAGDFLFFTDVQLEQGETNTPFERRDHGEVLQQCQRYFQRSGYLQSEGTHADSGTAKFGHQSAQHNVLRIFDGGSNDRRVTGINFNTTARIDAPSITIATVADDSVGYVHDRVGSWQDADAHVVASLSNSFSEGTGRINLADFPDVPSNSVLYGYFSYFVDAEL